MNKHLLAAAALLSLACLTTTRADWKRVAELQAGHGPTEIPVNRSIKCVQLQGYHGTCGITTLWIREEGKKTEYPISRAFSEGQKYNVDFPPTYVTGLRISDSGTGIYRVNVYETAPPQPRNCRHPCPHHHDDDDYDHGYHHGYDDGYNRGRRDAEQHHNYHRCWLW